MLSGPTRPSIGTTFPPLRDDVVDAAVIGGGVIGLATAWRLAQRDLRVAVIDPSPGSGASFVAGGMLGGVAETGFAEADAASTHVVARDSWDPFLAELSATIGRPLPYAAPGTVMVGFDRSDAQAIDHLVTFQRNLGLPGRPVDRGELDVLVPGLGRSVRSGYFLDRDAAVDNRAVVVALIEAATTLGVCGVSENCTSITATRSGLTVTTTEGQLHASSVVVATGAAPLPALPDATSAPAIYPVGGVILRMEPLRDVQTPAVVVRSVVRGRPLYLVPRPDGSLVLGATAVERGFDVAVHVSDLHQLLDDGRMLLPFLDECGVLDVMTGLRPTTPDHRPIVGATTTPGLYLALGHYRNGFLLAPATAEHLASLVASHGAGR